MSATQADWGTAGALSPMETIFWRVEADPRFKSTIVSLEILAGTPEWAAVVEAHERAVRAVPRLRERVVEAAVPLAYPRWAIDEQFTLDRHLRRMSLSPGSTMQDLFDAAATIASAPFDRSRPPWEAILITGLKGNRSAYVLKLHHSATDGTGIVQLLGHLHDSDSPAHRVSGEENEPRGTAPVTPWGVVGTDLRERIGSVPSEVASVVGRVRETVRDPRGSAVAGLRYGLSMHRLANQSMPSPSPLLQGRSNAWRFAGLECDLSQFRAAARETNGTLNDVFLAGLLGGYARYHKALGCEIAEIPISIPVSTRTEADQAGGNLFVPASLAGPLNIEDPAERIRKVGNLVRRARSEPALDHLARLSPALAKLPATIVAKVAGAATTGNDLQASNVRGTATAVRLGGALVERLYPFAPLPGCPAMITMVSHVGTVCFGINYDPASFTKAELFLNSLAEGFGDVLSVAGSTPTIRRAQ